MAEDDWDAVLLGVFEQGVVERDPANAPHSKTVLGLNPGGAVAPRELAQVFRQCGVLDQLLDIPTYDFVEQPRKEGEYSQAIGLQTEVRVSPSLLQCLDVLRQAQAVDRRMICPLVDDGVVSLVLEEHGQHWTGDACTCDDDFGLRHDGVV